MQVHRNYKRDRPFLSSVIMGFMEIAAHTDFNQQYDAWLQLSYQLQMQAHSAQMQYLRYRLPTLSDS